MPQKMYDKERLLLKKDTQDILTVFRIKGMNSHLSFSDCYHVFEDENNYPDSLFYNRRALNKDTLKNRLKQMVRAGILTQQNPREPYYLHLSWYNLPFRLFQIKLLEEIPLEQMMCSVDYDYYKWFYSTSILYGLNPLLLKKKKVTLKGISKLMKNIQETVELIDTIKWQTMRFQCKRTLDNYYKVLTKKERKFWDNEIQERRVGGDRQHTVKIGRMFLYEDLQRLSEEMVQKLNGKLKNTLDEVEEFYPEGHIGIMTERLPYERKIVNRAINELNKVVVKFYPFGIALFYHDCHQNPIEIKEIPNSDLRLFADETTLAGITPMTEYYDVQIQQMKRFKEIHGYDRKACKYYDEKIKRLVLLKKKLNET
jgi:hypothetical protein